MTDPSFLCDRGVPRLEVRITVVVVVGGKSKLFDVSKDRIAGLNRGC